MEDIVVSDVVADTNQARVTITGLPDDPGTAAGVFAAVADGGILVDMIIQNAGDSGTASISITVPANHIVEATGVLQNPEEVLTQTQQDRLAQALQGEEPVFIIAPDEVMTAASRPKQDGELTWQFKAEDVRDFACFWSINSKTFSH